TVMTSLKNKIDVLAAKRILARAIAAADAAALAVSERDGKEDCGICGGAMTQLDGRCTIAAVAVEMGLAYRSGSETWLALKHREADLGIASQNADIPQAAHRAFLTVLVEAGQGKAIKRHWDYID